MFCLHNPGTIVQKVNMDIASGTEARDYSLVAKKEHLEPVQVAMRKADDLLNQYHGTLLYMREREERMRATTDSTAFRVICFTVFNLLLMIGVAAAFVLSFKHFFRAKKLI
eukprot:Platyproteum_vivax@DN4425_c0_g1_i1.p1